jgi:hypothetical protein
MARRVPVELELLAGQYLAQARLVEQRTAAMDREMGQLDRSIDAVDRDMAELAAASTVAAGRVDNLGDQARQSATAMSALDARIKATKMSVRELGMEFARTGEAIDGRAYARETSLLARLEKLKKSLEGMLPGDSGETAVDVSSGGIKGLGRMSASNPIAIGAIGGAVTAVALGLPTLGAMIAGIVAGGVGTGGVIGGVAMAARDPHLRDAAADFGNTIADEFFSGGGPFVKPAIKALEILESGFKRLDLGDSFAKVAPEVEIIAHGLDNMVRNIMPGLNKAFDRMDPFANAASEGMAELGSAVGDMIDSVTESEGAVMGLEAAFNLVNNTIVAFGGLVQWLSNGFERFVNVLMAIGVATAANPFAPDDVRQAALFMVNELRDLNIHGRDWVNTAGDGTHAIESFGEAATRATIETTIFNDAISATYSMFLDFQGSAVSAERAIDDLADALLENGLNFDIDTRAGQDNVDALLRVAKTAEDATRKKLTETQSIEEANAVYDEYRQKLFDAAIQAGATAEMAQELVDKWLAMGQLQDITKSFTIYETKIRAVYGPDPNVTWGGGFQEFADGGTVLGPRGEPQLIVAHGGEKVANSAQQAAQQWGGSTTWGGSDRTITVIVKDTSGRTLKSELITDALNRNIPEATVRAAYP